MNVTLVKVVGEEDNNGSKTEFFRLFKVETILMQPQVETWIKLIDGSRFFIYKLEQDLQKCVVYLYNFHWYDYHEFWGRQEEFDKIEQEIISKGWSRTDKHKIIRGEI